ncbi:MAG: hypothetical protein QOJ39_1506 [Candidatus Eremiobacteraeota bacterium]|nr:hypothetical protein [Candidatus Eremiobacteraeota bacterium]MEA2719642.1 hypothetical protein [Candidatus Eremiobacteraeota bacterium]
MPVAVRVLNWNIQNFGPTKSGVKRGNLDVVKALAKVVHGASPPIDIFVMLELNTTVDATAVSVATMMQQALAANGGGNWQHCILSPNTGLEYYAFFIRDIAKTVPMTITGPVVNGYKPVVLGGDDVAVTAGEFTAYTTAGVPSPSAVYFPFIQPDLRRDVRLRTFPTWTSRLPVLAPFYIPGASGANRLFPIVACHFSANLFQAAAQLDLLQYFSLLRYLAPGTPGPIALRVKPPGAAMAAATTNSVVLLGDFNVDWLASPNAYAPLTTTLGATAGINDTTHLVTYSNYSPRVQKTTAELAVNAYDNIFWRLYQNSPVAAAITSRAVYNVPEAVRQRFVTLSESVDYYAELDQRGFTSSAYTPFAQDFANQLAGDKSNYINVTGSLVGGRLLSDHLPVFTEITLA